MLSELKNYLKDTTGENWELQPTENKDFGDYASNLAFRLAKERYQSPLEAAKALAESVKSSDSKGYFAKVEAAPPGFVNFWLSPELLYAELGRVLKQKNKYGRTRAGKAAKKINLEFVSANPTGPLTMANGRGGFLGDVLGNILEAAGNKVTRED